MERVRRRRLSSRAGRGSLELELVDLGCDRIQIVEVIVHLLTCESKTTFSPVGVVDRLVDSVVCGGLHARSPSVWQGHRISAGGHLPPATLPMGKILPIRVGFLTS